MRSYRIHLIPGHGGSDTGCVAGDMVESKMTGQLAWQLAQLLRGHGFDAQIGLQTIGHGGVQHHIDRVAAANKQDAVALCLHYNCGGGEYSSLLYDEENPQSVKLAECLKKRLTECLKGVSANVKIEKLKVGERGHVCIAGIKHSAVLLEPLFLDNAKHAAFLSSHENRESLAEAIAQACVDYDEKLNPPAKAQ